MTIIPEDLIGEINDGNGGGEIDAYTKTETDTLLGAKADKATTLSGYGITDAYTKSETDAKYATKDDLTAFETEQTTIKNDLEGLGDQVSEIQGDVNTLKNKVNSVPVIKEYSFENESDVEITSTGGIRLFVIASQAGSEVNTSSYFHLLSISSAGQIDFDGTPVEGYKELSTEGWIVGKSDTGGIIIQNDTLTERPATPLKVVVAMF